MRRPRRLEWDKFLTHIIASGEDESYHREVMTRELLYAVAPNLKPGKIYIVAPHEKRVENYVPEGTALTIRLEVHEGTLRIRGAEEEEKDEHPDDSNDSP